MKFGARLLNGAKSTERRSANFLVTFLVKKRSFWCISVHFERTEEPAVFEIFLGSKRVALSRLEVVAGAGFEPAAFRL